MPVRECEKIDSESVRIDAHISSDSTHDGQVVLGNNLLHLLHASKVSQHIAVRMVSQVSFEEDGLTDPTETTLPAFTKAAVTFLASSTGPQATGYDSAVSDIPAHRDMEHTFSMK